MNRSREKAALPLGRSSAPRGWAGLLARGLPYSLRLPIRRGFQVPGSKFRVPLRSSRFRVPGSRFVKSQAILKLGTWHLELGTFFQLGTWNTEPGTFISDSGVSQISTPLTVAGQQRPGPAPFRMRGRHRFPCFRLQRPSPARLRGIAYIYPTSEPLSRK
jgi:hypothetical protein